MKEITDNLLVNCSDTYSKDSKYELAKLCLSKGAIQDCAFNYDNYQNIQPQFSIDIRTLEACNQKMSGRCWLFAATNVLREGIAKKCRIKKFELSQSYLAFWDKFERCNYFLESIINTASLPTTDRTVSHILQTGVHDGGQWAMFSNIVKKYGLVPKACYPETFQSSNTKTLNLILNQNLKACAIKLRNMIKDGKKDKDVESAKEEMLTKIYSFLVSAYGVPPKTFDFEYVSGAGHYHLEKGLTPHSFVEEYVGDLLDNVVSIINSPTEDKPMHKTFKINYLGNVVGGDDVKHLNITMDEMKEAIIAQLKDKKVVWFGSDVSNYGDRDRGFWDDKSFNYELLTGLDLDINKADGLDYSFSAMNHAMVITGVNLVDGKPTKWKIENSWGDDKGVRGYYVMSDSWFDKYVYQAAIEKQYLGDLAKFADEKPIELDPWDPMGTLAD